MVEQASICAHGLNLSFFLFFGTGVQELPQSTTGHRLARGSMVLLRYICSDSLRVCGVLEWNTGDGRVLLGHQQNEREPILYLGRNRLETNEKCLN